ncbi:MAG: Ig-like domain-containing protein [Anaerolineales bacterium]|nr:Ig-like domain-containing protein [Anaerolineales bacterium]
MTPSLRTRLAGLSLALVGAWCALPASAQALPRYFPETGHTLDPVFAEFFDRSGGTQVLGYPITDSFVDSDSGRLLQYFENARLETALEDRGPGSPSLSPLGEMLGGWDPPRKRLPALAWTEPGCRYFRDSGHSVCHAYLDFYNSNGAAQRFGSPISDYEMEAGRLVQYFRSFRLDWLPETPPAGQVRIAPLGRLHFDQSGFDPELLAPRLPEDPALYRVLSLKPNMALSQAVAKPDDMQQVLVLVRDQNDLPVPGASVTLSVRYPEAVRTFLLPLTDADGMTRFELEVVGQVPGSNVELLAWSVFEGLQASTRDSFRIWW